MEFHKYTISKKGIFRKSFEIYDSDGQVLYVVSTPGWIFYNHVIFRDRAGKEVLLIERFSKIFNAVFSFTGMEGTKGEFTKDGFAKDYILKSNFATYTAKGNWWGDEYTIYLGDDDIAKVSRSVWSDNNQYGIAIIEGNHNLFILGMIISIELVKMRNNDNG